MLEYPNLEAKSDTKPVHCPGAWLNSVCAPCTQRKQYEQEIGGKIRLAFVHLPFSDLQKTMRLPQPQ